MIDSEKFFGLNNQPDRDYLEEVNVEINPDFAEIHKQLKQYFRSKKLDFPKMNVFISTANYTEYEALEPTTFDENNNVVIRKNLLPEFFDIATAYCLAVIVKRQGAICKRTKESKKMIVTSGFCVAEIEQDDAGQFQENDSYGEMLNTAMVSLLAINISGTLLKRSEFAKKQVSQALKDPMTYLASEIIDKLGLGEVAKLYLLQNEDKLKEAHAQLDKAFQAINKQGTGLREFISRTDPGDDRLSYAQVLDILKDYFE